MNEELKKEIEEFGNPGRRARRKKERELQKKYMINLLEFQPIKLLLKGNVLIVIKEENQLKIKIYLMKLYVLLENISHNQII